jgi:adenylate cyclase
MPDGMKKYELPEGPSIAVLPFVNMSGDPEQEYFSDGLTDNIIAGLSSDYRLLVIARNSTFAYKGKSVKVQEIARELGAQYVVEGSVQKTEDRVRITVQLIDTKTGHHVWADTYDRELKDIFALQDEITMKIMIGVGRKLVAGEELGEKLLPPSGSLEVFKKTMKALDYFYRMNREGNILARKELEETIPLDPEYSMLYSTLACTHLLDLWFQSSESPVISFAQASKNIKKALALDDEDYFAHVVLANLYALRKEPDKAIAALERAITFNPNGALAYAHLGASFIAIGQPEKAIRLIKKAIHLDPIPPAHYLHHLANAYYVVGRYEDAIKMYKQAIQRSPDDLFIHIGLTATYTASGRDEEARKQAERLLELHPTFSIDEYAETIFRQDEAGLERHIANLRKAGLK